MKARVSRKFPFDAAHFLPGYPGKCANLHGHTWFVEPTFEGEIDPRTGMVVDFSTIKAVMNKILESLDHKLVNDIIENPTAENIAAWLTSQITLLFSNDSAQLISVKVWETPESCAEVCLV